MKFPEIAQDLAPSPTAETADDTYRLLKGHPRTDGTFKTDDQLRTEYVSRTDGLIRLMTDGVGVTDRATGEYITEKPDYVVWLDKSARPVAQLTRELWPRLAPAPGQPVPEMPKFRFVNIDREQWVNTVDPQGIGSVKVDRVDPSIIRSLRSIFVSPEQKKDGLTPAIDNAHAELDDRTTLIVDEVRASGRTLEIAQNFFERAFPTGRFAATHWMGGIVQMGLATGNADLPVWYQRNSNKGRGIGNRDEGVSSRSPSATQRLGAHFLSTRLPEPDPDSVILRKELVKLAHDPDVLVVPSIQRDDFVERAEALNGMSFEEFKVAKAALNGQRRPS